MPFLVLSEIFGLPSHALLVHAAVVLVPLAAVALVVTGWRADWRRQYGFGVMLLAVAGAGFSFLAKQSGGALRKTIRAAASSAGTPANFGGHPQQGDRAFIVAVIFGLTAVAWWAVDRYRTRAGLPGWAPVATYVVAVGVGGLATLLMVIAGHSGATLVWNDVGTYAGMRQ
jgi:hypothetical protein